MHIPPNWGTFFTLIVSFLVFWFIFSRIFFRPFLDLLSKREKRFKTSSEQTEQLIKQAQAADEEREQRIMAVRREASARREAQRREADAEAAKVLEDGEGRRAGNLGSRPCAYRRGTQERGTPTR